MPNFVPEGEDNSTSKRPFGRASNPNFVPGPDHVAEKGAGADGQYEEAQAANKSRQATAKQARWDEAVAAMKAMHAPSVAVGFLENLPPSVREVYILAEECYANRSAILGYFPPAGPTARATWAGYAKPRTKPRVPVATKG